MTAIWIALSILGINAALLLLFRNKIRMRVIRLSHKLKMQTLRQAINDADKDKAKTGRKNIVVYDTDTQEYRTTQKKLLKSAANAKERLATPNGFRRPPAKKLTPLSHERVRTIERKSPYATN